MSSSLIHHGEEPPISGQNLSGSERGSGTIFFARCPLHCVFCQNWQISQAITGTKNPTRASVSHRESHPEELAGIMLDLEARGALNINLISPTPYVPQIVMALRQAKTAGLNLPIVYNSGGYDSLEALRLLDGLIDIYLPDAKLAPESKASSTEDDLLAARLLGVSNYVRVNRTALWEMFRQCGHLRLDERGVACRGVLIRHLVLPGNLARTRQLIPWLAENFGPDLCLSLMAQYQPLYLVHNRPKDFRDLPDLSRTLREEEYDEAVDLAMEYGLTRTFIQELASAGEYLPNFTRRKVF